jgi:hypothetical protein
MIAAEKFCASNLGWPEFPPIFILRAAATTLAIAWAKSLLAASN